MSEALKLTTLKNYIKEKTGLRLETAAAELLHVAMGEKIGLIVERAAFLAEAQEKTTLQDYDMQKALDELEGPAGASSPEEVFELLEQYEVRELGDVVRLLRESLSS